jgi:hypothetical protein
MFGVVACGGGESGGGDALASRTQAVVSGSGVPECDAYLTAYETCINSVVPTADRPTALQGLHKSRNSWALRTSIPERSALARMCIKAERVLAENSCTWSPTGSGTGGASGSGGSGSGGSAGSGGTGGTCTVQNAQQISAAAGAEIILPGNACFKINQAPGWTANKIKLQARENGNPPTYPYPMDFTWFQASGAGCTTNGTPASAQLTANWNEKVLPPSTNLAASCPLVVKFSEAASPTFKFAYHYQ